jgi:hypothetical protein
MDMRKILQAFDSAASATPVEGSNDMKKFMAVVTEGVNPHKVALPVQMAMQHYSTTSAKKTKSPSLLERYFTEAEQEYARKVSEEQEQRQELINQYAQAVAQRVRLKNTKEGLEDSNPCWKGYKPVGTKKKGGKTVPNCVPKR